VVQPLGRLLALVVLPVLVCALLPSGVHAYGANQCAGDRFGSNLVCTANDVQITEMTVTNGPASCTGGELISLDLALTVNFGSPNRYDVGIFLANDGLDPQLTVANGGATSCTVSILPNSSPFLDLDPDGGTDTCGDGNGGISGGTGTGVLNISGVSVPCQAVSNDGTLYIPFIVSWDNQASPSGGTCTSIADPVPNTKSKCNAPDPDQGTVSIVVLPSIAKTDGVDLVTPGESTTYQVVITNATGVTLSTGNGNAAVFQDPAVAGLSVSGVTCSASGGASCPASPTVAAMQGAGLTVPSMPPDSAVTFSLTASVTGTPIAGSTIVNTAMVTSNGESISADDTNTVVYPSLVNAKTVSVFSDPINGTSNPKNIPGALTDYTIRITNQGQGSVDDDAVLVSDPIPANTTLFVGDLTGANSGPVAFAPGSPSSGLSWTFDALDSTTDDLEFSGDGGGSWSYEPTGSFDSGVTNIRMNPKGRMQGDTGSGAPYFELRFRVRVE
jgi:uncharacterized repeat protein (TIGR01451 family)